MIKRLLVLLGFIAVVGYVSQAEAKDRWPNWYVGFTGSTGFALDEDFGTFEHEGGWGAGVAVGYLPELGLGEFDNFRVEGEIFYRENAFEEASSIDVESTSYMANLYYDFRLKDMPIVPYVGAGLGTSTVEVGSADDDFFTWQLMGGLSFEIEEVPMVAFNVGYRFVRFEDDDAEAANHNLEAGVQLRF